MAETLRCVVVTARARTWNDRREPVFDELCGFPIRQREDGGWEHIDEGGPCVECGRSQAYHEEHWMGVDPNDGTVIDKRPLASMPLEAHPYRAPSKDVGHGAAPGERITR